MPDGGLETTRHVSPAAAPDTRRAQVRQFVRHCAQFRAPDWRRAVTQIMTTAVPFLALVAVMYALADRAYWFVLLLSIPAGGLLIRFFIIQHDCGHGSFLPSRKLNDLLGRALSVLTWTPYGLWRKEHAIHHAGSGNLDKRGVGDIDTLTVDEYLSAGWFRRVCYRVYRNPAFLFGFGVPFYFVVLQRLPWLRTLPFRECWKSTSGLNIAIVAIYGVLIYFVGFITLLKIVLPLLFIASAIGGWLFFIQHQFEETHWAPEGEWDFHIAAVHGSSYYVLPKVLQWFTGNIGLHHIHHLNSMVPNYRLQECMDALPALATINRLTLWESLRCVRFTLWDNEAKKLIGFGDLKQRTVAA